MPDDLISTRAAAERLGVSVWTIHKMIRTGRLNATKLGGSTSTYVISRADIDALVASRKSVAS